MVTKKALLIGINDYPGKGNDLKGCVNDVLMMGKVLSENYGFNNENVRILTDGRATTMNIRSRLEWLVRDATPESVLFFHFSGHGSQVRDRSGDELEDGLDEILCPYDLDWDNPFRDDELQAAIKKVPDGANFTIILDCCHSGTGTRQFFKERSHLRIPGRRFLSPPPDIGFRAAAGIDFNPESHERTLNMSGFRKNLKVRKFGVAHVKQNAVLVAGCRSDQTSADAWIDNDYHGALTYSLYRAMRNRRFSLSYQNLIEDAGKWLETSGYEQIPQLETREEMRRWTVLGREEHTTATAAAEVAAPVMGETLSDTRATQVVFVHGIGDHRQGYSETWRRAFNRYLSLPIDNFHEVVWDDVFDKTALTRGKEQETPALKSTEAKAAEGIREELRALFEARQDLVEDITLQESLTGERGLLAMDRAADRGFFNWLLNFDEYIGDFIKYLASRSVRDMVNGRLMRKLNPLLQSGNPVVLVTHSWGTVVGYKTLSEINRGSVDLHVTLGSPLWMRTVRHILGLSRRRRACDHWINVDARGDIIGGKLHRYFDVDHDYKVPSMGGSPHNSYFHPDNVTVQRDIVAKTIREQTARMISDMERPAAGVTVVHKGGKKDRGAEK